MPRFFFDVPSPELADDEGLEMADADAACHEASMAAAEMLKDAMATGRSDVTLGVRDHRGRSACMVTARITVTRRRLVTA